MTALTERTCVACERDDGPLSLHHFDPGGCDGTFYGASHVLAWSEDARLVWVRTVAELEPLADCRQVVDEIHPYDRACRNTQHSGCTCMHPIDGRWCGRPRNDPIHNDVPVDDRARGGGR